MRLTMEVAPDGQEPFKLVAGPRDILRWERTGKGRSASQLADGVSMTAVYEIAFQAVTRSGRWSGSFDEFCDSVDVSPTDEDTDVDPTQGAASDGSSSSSPSPQESLPRSGPRKGNKP